MERAGLKGWRGNFARVFLRSVEHFDADWGGGAVDGMTRRWRWPMALPAPCDDPREVKAGTFSKSERGST